MYNRHKNRLQINSAGIVSRTTLPRLVLPALLATAGALTTPAFAAVTSPSAPNLTDASDSGRSFTDNITNVTQPIFSGTGTPFSTVTLFSGTTSVGSAIVLPSGQWTVGANAKLSDGTHTMTVRQTTRGVQSAVSASLGVVIDTLAPSTPSRADLATESDTGSSDLDNITSTTTSAFQGTATPGTFISLYNTTLSSVNAIGKATVSPQGDWKATGQVPPSSGQTSYFIRACARDAAGNVSSLSDVLAVFIDTEKPAAASLPDLWSADDTGASKTDNITNVTTPTFTVKTEPNGRVVLWGLQSSKELIGTAFANSSGYATIKAVKPLNNYYSVIADGYDLAGNKASVSSPTLNLNIDTVAPDVPETPKLDSRDDTGVYGDNTTNLKTARLSGHSNAEGDMLAFSYTKDSPDASVYHATAKVKFSVWSVAAPSLPDGVYEVNATDTDLAGNSSSSEFYEFTVDTTPPPAPSTPDMPSESDTGVSDSDNITNIPALAFQGTSKSTWSITLYNNGLPIASRESGVDSWFLQVKGVKPGPFHISARAFDVAGNSSVMSPQLTGLLDYTAPSAILTTPSATVVNNLNSLAGTAQDSTVNGDFSGLDKVAVGVRRFDGVIGGNGFWSGSGWISDNTELPSALSNGQWSKSSGLPTVGTNVSTQVQDGNYAIELTAYDKAGNSKQSNFAVTVDNTAPQLQIVTPMPNSLLKTLTDIHGTASDATGISGVTVSLQRKRNNVVYYWNGSAFTTVFTTIDAASIGFGHLGQKNINWDCNDQLPKATNLDSGLYTISATAYDAAGNSQVSTQSFSLGGSNASPGTRPSSSAATS